MKYAATVFSDLRSCDDHLEGLMQEEIDKMVSEGLLVRVSKDEYMLPPEVEFSMPWHVS